MEKFSRTLRGYDPEEVNAFIDKIIEQFETMVSEIKEKDQKIKEKDQKIIERDQKLKSYETLQKDYLTQKDKIEQFNRMEDTLKRAILMAEKTSEQIKLTAYQERDMIVGDAKKSANRIVNEALLKADTVNKDAEVTRRNIIIFKRRLRDIIESQLELVDDIEKIDI